MLTRIFSVRTIWCCLLVASTLYPHRVKSQESAPTSAGVEETNPAQETTPLNLLNKTTGGTQWWTDHVWRNGYRIQQNALTNHWRLLDPQDIRLTWGSRQHCDQRLAEIFKDSASWSSPKHVVVLLHGLMRTHHSMKSLENDLKQLPDTGVIRFTYASTRQSIQQSAEALRELLEGLPAGTKISFVGHSMGNIVTRHLIGDLQRDGDPKKILPRCESMVMLGPPNQGAAIARRIAMTGLFGLVTGQGGMELGPHWEAFEKRLATPPFPFVIVAGDVSSNTIQNPLVDGAGDFVVSLEEAKLEGAEAFYTVPVLHSFLMSDADVRQKTVKFLSRHR